ncbi:MAG: VWA domain-containing protein, partial [Polaromonas sp.]|nr:VWA domain-containing protein [Polaromonas sp.]
GYVGIAEKEDLSAAFEAVMISREQDRGEFRELFDVYFQDPKVANKLLAQLLPSAEGKAEPSKRRPRVREALAPQKKFGQQAKPTSEDQKVDFDAAMTASDIQRLQHADFNAMSATEYRLVERLARDIKLPLPQFVSRRTRPATQGARMHWPGVMSRAARTGGELLHLPRLQRRQQALPLLVLVDVSGSMERYARLLLAFLHAATRRHPQRDVFAFGMGLTDLTQAFKQADTDDMLAHASVAIEDFAGGTQLGVSLRSLRMQHARRLVGRRTIVLMITDGLDTGEPAELAQELGWLRRRSRRVLWLNPLLRFDGYAPLAQGAKVLHSQAHGMLAVHNLSKLEELAASLAALMKK